MEKQELIQNNTDSTKGNDNEGFGQIQTPSSKIGDIRDGGVDPKDRI